jgi:hypothetical protein
MYKSMAVLSVYLERYINLESTYFTTNYFRGPYAHKFMLKEIYNPNLYSL